MVNATVRSTRRGMGIVLVVVAAGAGCGLLVEHLATGPVLSRFPHGVHRGKGGAVCVECHGPADGEPVMPTVDLCADCHDEPVYASFFVDGAGAWARAGRQSEDIIFDHRRHAVADSTGCGACHSDVAGSSVITASVKIRMETCVQCHEDSAASCDLCHTRVRRTTRPATHGAKWQERHGAHVGGSNATADQCALCHEQHSCDQCHARTPPRSHTTYWRQRGHGVVAGMDRERCRLCHMRDACDRCHRTTRPATHRASFGTPGNRHCVSCHLPLDAGDHCGVCHDGTPSHDGAALMPDDAEHLTTTAEQCRACHVPMLHPDSGDDCRQCHR